MTLLFVTIVIGAPALLFTLWPLFRHDGRGRTFLPLHLDRRQQLDEEKRATLAALRELEFEHAAGHVSDADFADLRARYEGEAAAILTALDRLGQRGFPHNQKITGSNAAPATIDDEGLADAETANPFRCDIPSSAIKCDPRPCRTVGRIGDAPR